MDEENVAGIHGHPDRQQDEDGYVAMHLPPTTGTSQPAGVGKCSYKSNAGRRCQKKTATVSAQCAMHTCQAAGCSNPKSSRAQGCHQHRQLNAGLVESDSYATLRGDQQVYDKTAPQYDTVAFAHADYAALGLHAAYDSVDTEA